VSHRAAVGVGVVFGGFAGVVRRMKSVAVRDMRVVRSLLVIPFGMVFGSLAVVSRGVLVMFSSFCMVFGSFVVLHGIILFSWRIPRGRPALPHRAVIQWDFRQVSITA
jgi:hypothetical protein